MDLSLLGKKIREERTKQRYSQASLAEKLDISTNFLGQIERGERKPSVETLVRLSDVLGSSLDYLLLDDSRTKNPQEYLISDINQHLAAFSRSELLYFYNIVLNYEELKRTECV